VGAKLAKGGRAGAARGLAAAHPLKLRVPLSRGALAKPADPHPATMTRGLDCLEKVRFRVARPGTRDARAGRRHE